MNEKNKRRGGVHHKALILSCVAVISTNIDRLLHHQTFGRYYQIFLGKKREKKENFTSAWFNIDFALDLIVVDYLISTNPRSNLSELPLLVAGKGVDPLLRVCPALSPFSSSTSLEIFCFLQNFCFLWSVFLLQKQRFSRKYLS